MVIFGTLSHPAKIQTYHNLTFCLFNVMIFFIHRKCFRSDNDSKYVNLKVARESVWHF